VGQDLSTKYRVGPKGTEMRFLLINFERGYSTYEVHIWWIGGSRQDLSTKYRVGPKGTEMRLLLITFKCGYLLLVDGWSGVAAFH
jgi:hypothetical protein